MKTKNENLITVGCSVKFYDCQKANADKDYSGTNEKYYPIGKVIKVYDSKCSFGYIDKVCDVKIERSKSCSIK